MTFTMDPKWTEELVSYGSEFPLPYQMLQIYFDTSESYVETPEDIILDESAGCDVPLTEIYKD